MKSIAAFLTALLLSSGAYAQGAPSFSQKQVPSVSQWQGYFASKVDTNGGSLSGGRIGATSIDNSPIGQVSPSLGSFSTLGASGPADLSSGGTLGGTFTGGTFSGGTWSGSVSSGSITAGLGYTPLNKAGDTMGGALAVTPSSNVWSGSTPSTGFSVNQTATGSATATESLNQFTLNDTVSDPGQTLIGLGGQYNYGNGSQGGRGALSFLLCQCNPGADGDSGANPFFVGGTISAFARYSQPGSSSTTPLGHVFGFNGVGEIQAGFTATNYYQVAGAEFNVQISSGSSSAVRSGVTIADLNGSAQGFWDDDLIWLYGGGQPWRYGLMLGDSQPWPIDGTVGTIVGARIGAASYNSRPYAAKWGVDLEQVIFPSDGTQNDGGFLRSNGFNVDGAGTIYQGSCKNAWSSAGISWDCAGAVGTSAAIATAGTGYTTGTKTVPVTYSGGVWLMNVSGGGVPNGITQLVAPTNPNGTTPSNPVTPTNVNPQEAGTGLTLNITWNTTAKAISIGPSAATAINIGNASSTTTINGAVKLPKPLSLNGAYPTGRFSGAAVTGLVTNTGLSGPNRLSAMPFYVGTTSLAKTLSFDIGTGNASAWNAEMCIYADTGAGLPGSLVVDSGTVAVASGSVTGVQSASLNSGAGTSLPGPGWYWLAFMASSASESIYSSGNSADGPLGSSMLLGWSSVANAASGTTATGVYAAQTFGACPGTFSVSPTFADGTALPYVWVGF